MDIWSRRIVGWSMGPNITAELADEALRMALARRNPPRDACTTAIVRMYIAGLRQHAGGRILQVGTASQHPDPHSD